jgi:hypothetical protein
MQVVATPGFRSILGRTFAPALRPYRVTGLLAGVVLLSVGDLYMTLLHLTTFGMLEANPLARGIMAHGSPAMLAAWKTATVGLAVGILFWARRRATAEVAAVFCCLVLAWLTLRWVAYSDTVSAMTPELQALVTGEEPRFVTMAPGGE